MGDALNYQRYFLYSQIRVSVANAASSNATVANGVRYFALGVRLIKTPQGVKQEKPPVKVRLYQVQITTYFIHFLLIVWKYPVRRLTLDYERSAETAEAMVYIASIYLMRNRIK